MSPFPGDASSPPARPPSLSPGHHHRCCGHSVTDGRASPVQQHVLHCGSVPHGGHYTHASSEHRDTAGASEEQRTRRPEVSPSPPLDHLPLPGSGDTQHEPMAPWVLTRQRPRMSRNIKDSPRPSYRKSFNVEGGGGEPFHTASHLPFGSPHKEK